MSDFGLKSDILPQRLCSEIQLFDLCDLAVCRHKSGRFCTDQDLRDRFEKITEREIPVSDRYTSDDSEDMGEDYDYADDDEYSDDAEERDESDVREYDE